MRNVIVLNREGEICFKEVVIRTNSGNNILSNILRMNKEYLAMDSRRNTLLVKRITSLCDIDERVNFFEVIYNGENGVQEYRDKYGIPLKEFIESKITLKSLLNNRNLKSSFPDEIRNIFKDIKNKKITY